jgi:hypothetical protein
VLLLHLNILCIDRQIHLPRLVLVVDGLYIRRDRVVLPEPEPALERRSGRRIHGRLVLVPLRDQHAAHAPRHRAPRKARLRGPEGPAEELLDQRAQRPEAGRLAAARRRGQQRGRPGCGRRVHDDDVVDVHAVDERQPRAALVRERVVGLEQHAVGAGPGDALHVPVGALVEAGAAVARLGCVREVLPRRGALRWLLGGPAGRRGPAS